MVIASNGLNTSRLGLSVGRAIWKGAVRRNRVRRIFREAFRLCFPELPAGADLILIPARPRIRPELRETCEELLRLAPKALERQKRGAAPPGEEGTP